MVAAAFLVPLAIVYSVVAGIAYWPEKEVLNATSLSHAT